MRSPLSTLTLSSPGLNPGCIEGPALSEAEGACPQPYFTFMIS